MGPLGIAHNVCGKHAVVFAAKNDSFPGGKNNGATTTAAFNFVSTELYQQRERRAYRCWAPVTSGKEYFPHTVVKLNIL